MNCPDCNGVDVSCVKCDGTGSVCDECGEACNEPSESFCNKCKIDVANMKAKLGTYLESTPAAELRFEVERRSHLPNGDAQLLPVIKRGSCDSCVACEDGRCALGRSTQNVLVPSDLTTSGHRQTIAPSGKCNRPRNYGEFMAILRKPA